MTRRIAVLSSVAVIALVAVLVALRGLRPDARVEREPTRETVAARQTGDSTWYHASDPALLAATGRPQLVEFFHPG